MKVTEGEELVGAGGREAAGAAAPAEPAEEPRDVVDEGPEPQMAQQIQGPDEGDPSASGNRGRKNGEPDLVNTFFRGQKKESNLYLNGFSGGEVWSVRNKKAAKGIGLGGRS